MSEKAAVLDPLADLVHRDVSAAQAEALRSDGEVPPETLQRLQNLAALLELRAATRPPAPPPSRLPLAAAFVATLLVASALLFVRVPSTEIELDAVVSELSFVAATELSLTRPVDLTVVGLSGLTAARLPDRAPAPPGTAPTQAVKLSATGPDASISLDPIAVPAQTRIWVRRTSQARQYRLSFRSPSPTPMSVRAYFMGQVRVGSTAAEPAVLTAPSPREIAFESDSNHLAIDLGTGAGALPLFRQRLAVSSVSLTSVEDDPSGERPSARPLSSLRSGALHFESLEGAEKTLRAGELIALHGARGDLRTLELDGETIALAFHGTVRDIRAGAGEHPHSLMPTLLDWLRRRHGLSLLWGAALYGFGLLTAMRRWWRGAA